MSKYEIIGLIGTVFVLISMCLPSTHRRQNIRMRALNIVGGVIMTVYSVAIGAISSTIMNVSIISVNIFNIIKLVRSLKHPDPSRETQKKEDKPSE